MEQEQFRSAIRFLFFDGKTCEEIQAKLDVVYGDPLPSMTTVRYWFNEFKRGRTSVFDEERVYVVDFSCDVLFSVCRCGMGAVARSSQRAGARVPTVLRCACVTVCGCVGPSKSKNAGFNLSIDTFTLFPSLSIWKVLSFFSMTR